jgi:dienelactone hydrolase
MRLALMLCVCGLLVPAATVRGDGGSNAPPTPTKGKVHFAPTGDQKEVPERYRLSAHDFSWEMSKVREVRDGRYDIYQVRFPSPVKSSTPENNTVHAEYYRPHGDGPFPCVIILDITAGDQSVSRLMGAHLARHRIGGLFVQMAYYGPRRPKGSSLRLLSPNIPHTMEAIRQTVLDLRCATAWMESRPEIDAQRLGVVGTSLGSFVAALTAEMEPKLKRVAVLLGGGGLVDGYWDDPRAASVRKIYEAIGGTKEQVTKLLAPVDPITCAANLKDRKLLIMAAKKDDIVPPRMAEALWNATGRQRIVWFDCNHIGAALYVLPALRELSEHFGAK